ncbi:MAG TPA: hypothetical protein VIL32_07920 [Steroidobacteraceae bacterium]
MRTGVLGILLNLAFAACANHSAPQQADPVPDLASMQLAVPSSKVGVPVEVRYQVVGTPARNQPATLHLAFVPQVPGKGLKVEFPPSRDVAIETGGSTMTVQKATPEDVYRKNLLVTPLAGDAAQVRAMVWMEVEGGRIYFSIFQIPVGTPASGAEVRK